MKGLVKVFAALAALSIANVSPASAQMMQGDSSKLDAEVAGFPSFLQVAIRDYSARLIANANQFSEMDVSNCHFVSDTTAMIMQEQLDTIDEDLFLEWVVRSRGLAYLSLSKFKDHSKPLAGSYAEKVESASFSSEDIIALLPAENTRCTQLLVKYAGPVISRTEKNHGSSTQ